MHRQFCQSSINERLDNNFIASTSRQQNNEKGENKVQRYCFEFPSTHVRGLSKIVADYLSFATILEEMWNSNSELSPYQYPVVLLGKSDGYVYFVCKAQDQGCKFQIKLRHQITNLNEPAHTTKEAKWRQRLRQSIDIRNYKTAEISYYRMVYFENQHNHCNMVPSHKNKNSLTMPLPPFTPCGKLDKKQSVFDLEKEQWKKTLDHYRRRSINQQKKQLKDKMNIDKIKQLKSQPILQKMQRQLRLQQKKKPKSMYQQINKQMNFLKDQITKVQKKQQNAKKKLFGENVIFLCDYEEQYQSSKQPKQQKLISEAKNQQPSSPVKTHQKISSGYQFLEEIQLESVESSSESIKGQPCLYFYSNVQMQNNLQNYCQVVNIIQLQYYSEQVMRQNGVQKINRNTNYAYIFVGTDNNKSCVIFAVAVACNKLYYKKIRKSVVDKFFRLPGSEKIETIILSFGDTGMMRTLMQKQKEREQLRGIDIIFRFSFCLQAVNNENQSDFVTESSKDEKILRHYYEKKNFAASLTHSMFQYLYEEQKLLKNLHKSKLAQKTANQKQQYPLQFLYIPCAIHLQKIIMKMCFTMNHQVFGKCLLTLMNSYCFIDQHFMLLQKKLLKYKNKLFLCQMKKKKFLGLNILIDLESCVQKYFNLSQLGHKFTNQKMFKTVITKATENQSMFATQSKYWIEDMGDHDIKMDENLSMQQLQQLLSIRSKEDTVQNYSLQSKVFKPQGQLTDFEIFLLRKYPLFRTLFIAYNRKKSTRFQSSNERLQSRKLLMKRLPFYNQSTLYISPTCRHLILDYQIINLIKYSFIDVSERIALTSKAQPENEMSIVIWHHNQVVGVRKTKEAQNNWVCDCKLNEFFKVPCRHILKAMLKYQFNMMTNINSYWHKRL